MGKLELTRVSSKGQVVIPQDIRVELGLTEGTSLVVAVQDTSVVLKKVELPKIKSWKEVTRPFRRAAAKSGFTEKDLDKLIVEVRAAKK